VEDGHVRSRGVTRPPAASRKPVGSGAAVWAGRAGPRRSRDLRREDGARRASPGLTRAQGGSPHSADERVVRRRGNASDSAQRVHRTGTSFRLRVARTARAGGGEELGEDRRVRREPGRSPSGGESRPGSERAQIPVPGLGGPAIRDGPDQSGGYRHSPAREHAGGGREQFRGARLDPLEEPGLARPATEDVPPPSLTVAELEQGWFRACRRSGGPVRGHPEAARGLPERNARAHGSLARGT
jgi:hypothetical protein